MELAARIGTMAQRGAPLPYDAEVDWLASDSLSYIDTRITMSNLHDVDLMFQPMSIGTINSSVGYYPFGVWNSYLNRQYIFGWVNDQNSFYANFGKSLCYNNTGAIRLSGESIYKITTDGNRVSVDKDGIVIELIRSDNDFECPFTSLIFNARNSSGEAYANQNSRITRLYYCRILKNGELVFDAIPVRFTNENGVSEGAMYDRVSGQLFRNAGTGAFVIGPDVVSSRGGGY